MKEYASDLADRPQIVVANKCDLLDEGAESLERLRTHIQALGLPFVEMSAASHQGTEALILKCAEMLAQLPPPKMFEADYIPPEPTVEGAEDVVIRRDDGIWHLEGDWLRRVAATVNFSDYESRMFFDRTLRKAGIFDRLEQMGIQEKDTVCIYDLMFDYQY